MSLQVSQAADIQAALFKAQSVFAGYCADESQAITWSSAADYIANRLGYEAWGGENSQAAIVAHYDHALRQLHERRDYEQGKKAVNQLTCWQPGQVIQNWISVDAGHNVGKTWQAAALVSHFFDTYKPSIVYCFAPGWDQVNDLLFKAIRKQRKGKGLAGKVLDGEPRINHEADHFVTGKATNNDHNTGSERTHGQHEEYLMFVVDEAEGVESYVFDAIRSMASGGIAIVLILRNPRTTTCEAHKIRRQTNCRTFRISCLDHPNVQQDKELIPGAVRRQYVEEMLEGCEVVSEHVEDDYTFTVPWRPGVIYRPSLECLWRVLGIASSKGTDDTFCPPARYEAALKREPYAGDPITSAWIGVDAARYGNDNGTVYYRHVGRVRKHCEIAKKDGFEYYIKVKGLCAELIKQGVKRIRVRMDAGGGYHSTCCDNLRRDADLANIDFQVIEVHNNGKPRDKDKFADCVTEMYWHAGEALKALRLDSPSPKLERDLCERKYDYVIKTEKADLSNGMKPKTRLDVKQLVSKDEFKDKFHESPDDGDGLALCVAPDRIFTSPAWRSDSSMSLYR